MFDWTHVFDVKRIFLFWGAEKKLKILRICAKKFFDFNQPTWGTWK